MVIYIQWGDNGYLFGDTMTDTGDAVALLARRAELLRSLRDGSPTKRELAAAQSVSRSTVDRAVRDLEAAGLVEREDGVSLTLQGRLAFDVYEQLTETLDALDDASGVLDPLPPDATLDGALLRGASVARPDPVAPQRPYLAYQSALEGATAVRGFAPAVLDENVPRFRERIVEDEVPVDLTVAPAALDELVSTHSDAVETCLDTGRLTLRRADETLDYGLVLAERPDATVVCALVYDDRGLAGVLRNDERRAVRWAEDVYERLRADAEPLRR